MRKQEIFIITITILIWLITIKRPFWGISYFYFYSASWYNSLFRNRLESLHVSFYTPLIALFSLLVLSGKKVVFNRQIVLMTILFVWMCLSRSANGLEVLGGEYMSNFYKYIFAMFLISNIVDTKEKLVFFTWIMVIAYAQLAFVARYHDMFTPFYFVNRNNFALSLVGALSFPLFYLVNSKNLIRKAEAGSYLLILLYGLAGSHSRGGYLGAVVLLALFALNGFQVKKMLIVLLFSLYIIFNVSTMHSERFASIFGDHSTDVETSQGTGGQRLALWITALNMMKSNPVFGVGAGENPANFTRYASDELRERVGGNEEGLIKAHQMFLQVGSETGFVGLGILLMIIWTSFRELIVSRGLCKKNPEIIGELQYLPESIIFALAGILIAGQFGNYGYNLQIYALLFLAPCVRQIIEKHYNAVQNGEKVSDTPVIPVGLEVPFRTVIFMVFAYISLGL